MYPKVHTYIVTIQSYIRANYGKLAISDGTRIFKEGLVSGPEVLPEGIFVYRVDDRYSTYRVLIWERDSGERIAVICDAPFNRDRYCVACLLSHEWVAHKTHVTSDQRIVALNLPERISDLLSSNPDIGTERMQEMGADVIEKVVGEFIEELLNGNHAPGFVVDMLDLAYEVCTSYDRFDVSYASVLISSTRDTVSDILPKIKGGELASILSNSERQHSRKWILGSRDGIDKGVVVEAYLTLALREPISDYDKDIQCLLADVIGDPMELAQLLRIDGGYHGHERIVRREYGRGHISVARALAESIPRGMRDDHRAEYLNLRREIGLGDVDIRLFGTLPPELDGERFLALVRSRPGTDIRELMELAWEGSERTPDNLTFYCHNGMGHEVAKYLDDLDDGTLRSMADVYPKSMMSLSEALCEANEFQSSIKVCINSLENMVRNKYNVDDAVHMMRMLDDIYDRTGSKTVKRYMKDFRRRVKKRLLWHAYNRCGGGHF